MSKSFVKRLLLGFIVIVQSPQAQATGGFGPAPRWLENGGVAVDHSPEFFWEAMLRERAKSYLPAEKRVALLNENSQEEAAKQYAGQTTKVDIAEFHEAMTKGLIKPADPRAAAEAHTQTRNALESASKEDAKATAASASSPDPEFDSEFADYHRGVGKMEHFPEEAETTWKKLLARPKEERHYRSVWAAFMLGKLGLTTGSKETVKWFQQCRALAKDGFADALGLAADSYGWEAKAELEADHREEAAKLYLAQLALGDDSALISLKALIPDRGVIGGTMSFDVNAKQVPSDDANVPDRKSEPNEDIAQALVISAKTPVLQWLQTTHVLATETTLDWVPPQSRCQRWLAVVKAEGIKDVANADWLGWVAYTSGDYATSKEWLMHCKVATGLSRWLEAKLLRRDGKLDAAIKTMQQSVALLEKELPAPANADQANFGRMEMKTAARADLAVLHLSRADFTEALEQFAQTHLEDDMAYVAELLLSADELNAFVDKRYPPVKSTSATDNKEPAPDQESGSRLRELLGRRLVREDRYDEAKQYLPRQSLPFLEEYVQSLKKGTDAKKSKADRARAYFHAAFIITNKGAELMATMGEPDSLGRDQIVTTIERETGKRMIRGGNNKFVPAREKQPVKFHVRVTKEEKRRLEKNKVVPFRNEHYRYVALGLVWKAAALLPDQSDELADILNTAGNWMKGDYRGDDEAAGKFFQAIERRASKTSIGKAASAKHWFVDERGTWSSEELKEDNKNP